MPAHDHTRAFFDELAGSFGARYASRPAFRQRLELFADAGREALRRLGPRADPPLCFDLGCGPGAIAVQLAREGFLVRGVDASGAMVAGARALAARAAVQGRCRFEEGDLLRWLEAQPEQPQLIACSSVLEYLEEPERALALLCRKLAPGGTLAVSLPNRRSLLRAAEPALQLLLPARDRYRRVLGKPLPVPRALEVAAEAGLRPARVRYFGFPSPGGALLGPLSSSAQVGTLALLELVAARERRLHFVVNATSARLGGGLTVVRNLLPALARRDGGRHRYTLLLSPAARAAVEVAGERIEVAAPRLAARRPLRLAWEQLALPASLRGADALLSPANLAAAACPIPQVLVFQNIAPFDPALRARAPARQRLRLEALRALGVLSARAADRVVFLSAFSRDLLLPQLGIGPRAAAVVHLGRDPAFAPEARSGTAALLGRLGLREPYLLSVANAYFYKNLVELVEGFARALPALPEGCTLALAGALVEPAYAARLRATVARHRLEHRVRLLGEVAHAELPALLAGALLFVFQTTCENFPNTLVEGMAAGAPTLTAGVGPMPEIAGAGAAYYDPSSPAEIAEQLVRFAGDPQARRELAARGLVQAQGYSWDRTADGLLAVLEDAA